ncbi:MAG: TIGR04211 family SH3 domain-containing protein [Deltaproteobacteria bacterium]|nr:TIGR04211 family SH3 domain-containing protein [Deltaproteobacteria bacterium]
MNRIRYSFFLLIACSLCWMSGVGLAETMYVTDRLYLSLRNTPELEQPSIAVLPSDTAVEVLETDNGWAKVKLEDGRTGWVLKKYLVRDLPKSVVIERLQGRIRIESLTIQNLKDRIRQLSLTIEQLQKQVKNKSAALERLEQQGVGKPSPVTRESGGEGGGTSLLLARLRDENASLKRQLSELESLRAREAVLKAELGDLKQRIAQDSSDETAGVGQSLTRRKEVYLIAAGALLVGLILGYMARRPDKNRFYLR